MSAPHDVIAGRYRLVELVGTGGMGSVWRAFDERLRRTVAVKQLHRPLDLSPAEVEVANRRAMREARITARLHHRHAVTVYDVVEHDGVPCLIMQFLPSIPLSTVLRETGPLLPHEAAKVGAQISAALAAAHAAGIVHRDVKPGNILIGEDGDALISDFGIAHALGDATLTTTGMVHGTPAFLAPEVARGAESSFASDVFSLGSTLYAAVEGSPPFGLDANTIALLHRVAAGVYPPPRRSGALTELLVHMLTVDPAARPTMQEVASRLGERAASTATAPIASAADESAPPEAVTEVTAPPAPAPARTRVDPAPLPPGPPSPTRRRGPAVPIVAALLVIALVVAGAWWLAGRPGTEVAAPPPTTTLPTSPEVSAPEPTPSPSETASSEPAPSPTRTPASRSPTPTPRPSPTKKETVDSTPSARQLAEAITSYYALMPTQTDEAWDRLTPAYRRSPAGGRQAFERFWSAIQRVSAREVVGNRPDRAEATITYVFKDGRVVTERTAYGLVNDDGTLKINTSQVLSSRG